MEENGALLEHLNYSAAQKNRGLDAFFELVGFRFLTIKSSRRQKENTK